MNFIPLASSSAGNAYIVEDGKTRILIECGVPYRRLQRLMGFDMADISGCLLSHEHHDHAKCHLDLIKNGVAVYASEGTAEALECEHLKTLPYEACGGYASFSIGTFDVLPFSTFHDAAEPVGYLLRSSESGGKLMFATDTVNIGYRFPGVTTIALECNYDEQILERATRLPDKVRHRIRNSHMDIVRVCTYLSQFADLSSCDKIYLLHLSDACSNEGDFLWKVKKIAPNAEVVVCPK